MDKLIRLVIKQNRNVIIDDKHEGYDPSKYYKTEKEILENNMVIEKYYE